MPELNPDENPEENPEESAEEAPDDKELDFGVEAPDWSDDEEDELRQSASLAHAFVPGPMTTRQERVMHSMCVLLLDDVDDEELETDWPEESDVVLTLLETDVEAPEERELESWQQQVLSGPQVVAGEQTPCLFTQSIFCIQVFPGGHPRELLAPEREAFD